MRSACTYVGAARLDELAPRVTFIRVTAQENRVYTGSEAKEPPAAKNGNGAEPAAKKPRT